MRAIFRFSSRRQAPGPTFKERIDQHFGAAPWGGERAPQVAVLASGLTEQQARDCEHAEIAGSRQAAQRSRAAPPVARSDATGA